MAIKKKLDKRRFTNAHQNYNLPIEDIFDIWNEPQSFGTPLERYNDTVDTLQQLVNEAIQDGVRLRAYGSRWSLSKAPHTDGRMINTKPLNLHFELGDMIIAEDFARDKNNLLFVQCGCAIQEINDILKAKNKSLKTSGASNGQTIAGAISTGTHGSTFNFGAVQDFVVGLHIIAGDGHNYYLERATDPITTPDFAKAINAKSIKNDTLFNDALVSFGSFGIIHGVLVEATDIFHLEVIQDVFETNKVKKAIESLDFSDFFPFPDGDPFHLQVYIDPYKRKTTYIKAMSKQLYKKENRFIPPENPGTDWSQDMPHFIGAITDKIPSTIPLVVSFLMKNNYKPYERSLVGTLGEIFKNTRLLGKVTSAAIGVPLENTEKVLTIYNHLIEELGPIAAVISLRYVKGSKATMAFTRFPMTCIFEIDGIQSKRTRQFLEKFWARLRLEQIEYTQHWGKANDLHRSTLYCYGTQQQQWLESRSRLLDEANAKVFESPFLNSCGLNRRIHGVRLEDVINEEAPLILAD